MSLNCNIVQDFVSLYVDNAISDKTKHEIEDHLSHCPVCCKYYKNYEKMNKSLNVKSDTDPFKDINLDINYAYIAKEIKKSHFIKVIVSIGSVILSIGLTILVLYYLHGLF